MCIMVMLKAKDTSTFQRHTVWVTITFTRANRTRMYQNTHYWMNVMLKHIKNTISRLNACCLFHFIKVLLQKVFANRHDVHLPGLEINQLSKQSGFHSSLFVFFTFICLSEAAKEGNFIHWRRSESVHKLHHGLFSWRCCAGAASNVKVIRHQTNNYYVSSFISNEKKTWTMTNP